MGLTITERQAVEREYKPRYQKATKHAKPALLGEFIRLTGRHGKSLLPASGLTGPVGPWQ
ncbi:hypothetical protein Holit_00481 [Hollandina sp. SP2]